MMATHISDDRLREILAGCVDVTPGPWKAEGRPPNMTLLFAGEQAGWRPSPCFFADGDQKAVSAHVARLDPQTVASIVSELMALRLIVAERSK